MAAPAAATMSVDFSGFFLTTDLSFQLKLSVEIIMTACRHDCGDGGGGMVVDTSAMTRLGSSGARADTLAVESPTQTSLHGGEDEEDGGAARLSGGEVESGSMEVRCGPHDEKHLPVIDAHLMQALVFVALL